MSLYRAMQAVERADDREAARLFVEAFDEDSIQAWISAVKRWDDRPCRGKIGDAVRALRQAFYHDGSDDARANCRAKAEILRKVCRQRGVS